MKNVTKYAIGAMALVAVSAGVGGGTAYTLLKGKAPQAVTSFDDSFDTVKGARMVGLDAASLQPVDLTSAAEITLNSVVHITSIQRRSEEHTSELQSQR